LFRPTKHVPTLENKTLIVFAPTEIAPPVSAVLRLSVVRGYKQRAFHSQDISQGGGKKKKITEYAKICWLDMQREPKGNSKFAEAWQSNINTHQS
jgi:hypothetical protein